VTLRIDMVGLDEAEQFQRVMRLAFESLRGRLDPPSGSHTETLDSVRAWLAAAGGFLARFDSEIVGCARWRPEPDHLYAGRVGVLPEFRGRGIAAALMHAIEDVARQRGLPQVRVEVREPLADNLRFYERLGYRRLSVSQHPRGPDRVVLLARDVG
jgi:ribosomal protein S18 acetylase RimI-like enzyme